MRCDFTWLKMVDCFTIPTCIITYAPWGSVTWTAKQSIKMAEQTQAWKLPQKSSLCKAIMIYWSLQWCHNEHDDISNHMRFDCLLSHLFRCRSKKISKLHVIGLCEGNSPVTGKFPTQRASIADNVSIWWRHDQYLLLTMPGLEPIWHQDICNHHNDLHHKFERQYQGNPYGFCMNIGHKVHIWTLYEYRSQSSLCGTTLSPFDITVTS